MQQGNQEDTTGLADGRQMEVDDVPAYRDAEGNRAPPQGGIDTPPAVVRKLD